MKIQTVGPQTVVSQGGDSLIIEPYGDHEVQLYRVVEELTGATLALEFGSRREATEWAQAHIAS